MLGIKFAMVVTSPRPARPGLEEKTPRSAGQIALEILRGVHRVDGILDRPGLGVETVLTLVPNTDGEESLERDGLPLHQRVDFLLLFLHDGEQRDFLFAGVITGDA